MNKDRFNDNRYTFSHLITGKQEVVMFSAAASSTKNYRSGDTIRFDYVFTNIGGGYDK